MNSNMNPKDNEFAKLLEASAQDVNPSPAFIAKLEDKLKDAHKPQPRWNLPDPRSLFTVVGWAGALVALTFLMNWAIRTLAPNPPQPASQPTPVVVTPTPKPFTVVATPEGEAYEWNGTQLYITAPLPAFTGDLPLFVAQAEQPATFESARALAEQFGMNGQAYIIPSEVPGSSGGQFLFVDGNQRLQVRSDQYFNYYPDYTRSSGMINPADHPDAETLILDFLTAKGFSTNVRIERTDIVGSYKAIMLTPDGYPIHYIYLSAAALTFQFDRDGITSVSANLIDYAPANDQRYGIISAEKALEMLLDPNMSVGLMISQSFVNEPITTWLRPRPENETVTLWGWMNSYPSAENGAPLVSLDGFTAIGNIADFPASTPNTFVEVTGQFQNVDGTSVFYVESWNIFDGYEDGIFGSLQRDSNNVVMVTPDRGTFILPDVPADVPIPMEEMYATGVARGDIFEWKSLDTRPSFGGGGGGGGGVGFYKVNLTGTPVPFPTAGPILPSGPTDQGYPYTVVAGDTCQSIADTFIVDVNSLIAVNNLPADCSTLTIDQVITIPYTTAMPAQPVNQRGILSVTIVEKADGSQRANYGFLTMGPSDEFDTFYYYILEGDGLEPLQEYNGRPVDIWGTLALTDEGIVKVNVERFEIPFPDLQFEILKGTEQIVDVDGQSGILFTDENGNSYVELGQNCHDILNGDEIAGTSRETESSLIEALPVPGLTAGGYPAVCVFASTPAIEPTTNRPMELTVMADQVSIIPEMTNPEGGDQPIITIEKVELVYYIPTQPHLTEPDHAPVYIQPVWHFYGHYSDGTIFDALIQALDPLFLLPEIDETFPPG